MGFTLEEQLPRMICTEMKPFKVCLHTLISSDVSQEGRKPANPAFWWVSDEGEEVKWSFEELGSLSRKAANVLLEACALQRGDRVIAVLPRVPEWWLLNVACMRAGG